MTTTEFPIALRGGETAPRWLSAGTAPLRSAYWSVRGLGTKNPPFPGRIESMLFVCLGNICRSPFAAGRATQILREAGRGHVRCTSAGIRPSRAGAAPPDACEVSAAYGVPLRDHVAQAVTPRMIRSHDIVIVMEWRHRRHLRNVCPARSGRIFLLPLFDPRPRGPYERLNIADPFARPRSAYEACYDRIERSLRACLERAL